MILGARYACALPNNEGISLDRTIIKTLSQPTSVLKNFASSKRQILIRKNTIEICGIEVWSSKASDDMRKVLELISKSKMSGAELDDELGRDGSNSISKQIKEFRDKCSAALGRAGMSCGIQDVIVTDGGYCLASNVSVVVSSDPIQFEGVASSQAARMNLICSALDNGEMSKDQLRKIAHVKIAQLDRDIRELETRGKVARVGSNKNRTFKLKG